MKKLLLLAVIAVSSTVTAQVFTTENFDALMVGDLSTNITGATAGQGGWFTESTNGAAPTTSTNAANSNFQIISSGGSNALQLVGANGDKGSRFIWQNGLPALWTARTAGNNIIEVEVDITRAANGTSKNRMGVGVYNSNFSRTLVGFSVDSGTGELFLIAYATSGGVTGNYRFSLVAAPGLLLPANATSRIGVSYNYTTGQVRIKAPGIAAAGLALTGASPTTAPAEIDFTCEAGGDATTPNTVSATAIFDNFVSKAAATDTLLGTERVADNSNKFSVSPNPTTGLINVTNNEGITVNEITVTDLNGRVVKTERFENVSNIQVNISDLSAGMYMMSIKSDAGTATKKVIKN